MQLMKTHLSFFILLLRNHPLARECDIVETLHMRLTLLQMTFGKHIERKHVCFFAGEVRVKISIRCNVHLQLQKTSKCIVQKPNN